METAKLGAGSTLIEEGEEPRLGIAVPKGTKVTVKLVNNVPSEPARHGFAIPAYNIQEVVNRGEPKTVEFTADKAGVFPFNCQLHPAHVGGQLIVLP